MLNDSILAKISQQRLQVLEQIDSPAEPPEHVMVLQQEFKALGVEGVELQKEQIQQPSLQQLQVQISQFQENA